MTACSRYALDDALERFGSRRSVGEVVFNGVALDREDTRSNRKGRNVLVLGRLVEKKGFDLAIEAFARVAERHKDATLVIGGEGPMRTALERHATQSGVRGRTRFLGSLDGGGVSRAMADADVFVVPSRIEPFGIVILEAWRASLPVIVTNRGGPREFVRDGEDGVLVDPTDVKALAEALDRMLSSQALRNRVGAAGRGRLCKIAWPKIAKEYQSIYTRALRG